MKIKYQILLSLIIKFNPTKNPSPKISSKPIIKKSIQHHLFYADFHTKTPYDLNKADISKIKF